MTIYFKIKLSEESGLTLNIFNKLLEADIAFIKENGDYFGEEIKIKCSETEIEFGYSLVVAKYIFKNIFDNVKVENIHYNIINKYKNTIYGSDNYLFWKNKTRKFLDKRKKLNAIENGGSISSTLPTQLSDDFFSALINKNGIQGIILGEEPHGQEESRRILIDYIEIFKKYGVKTICLEGFLYQDHQKLLDDYIKSNKETLPIELLAHAEIIQNPKNKQLSYSSLIQFFKQHDIRIIAIDHITAVCADSHTGLLEDRLFSLNIYAKEIITKEINVDQKYIVFVGSGHAFDTKNNRLPLKTSFLNDSSDRTVYSLKKLLPHTTNLIVCGNDSYCDKERIYTKYDTFFNYNEHRRVDKQTTYDLEADIVIKYGKK